MTRREWEWIIGWGLVLTKVFSEERLAMNTLLPIAVMQKCPKCKREYYAICIPCLYRHGGDIPETEEVQPRDLCDQMAALTNGSGYSALASTLRWMRTQGSNQWP